MHYSKSLVWLSRRATGRNVIVAVLLSLVFLIFYFAVVFPPLLRHGVLLDQMSTFTAADVQHKLAEYGPALRSRYVWAEVVDVFIAGITGTVALTTSYLAKKVSWSQNLARIALLAGLLNTMKSGLMIYLIHAFPALPVALVTVTSFVNSLKSMAMIAALVTLIILLIRSYGVTIRRKLS